MSGQKITSEVAAAVGGLRVETDAAVDGLRVETQFVYLMLGNKISVVIGELDLAKKEITKIRQDVNQLRLDVDRLMQR